MKHIKFLFIVFVMLVIFILLVQNHAAFNTKVVFKVDLMIIKYQTSEISVYLISLIAFILGVIITWVFNLLERFQFKRQISNLSNELKKNDNELNSLRNLAITSEDVTPGIKENDIELA